mmetsp:Transcript_15995/g.24209  ORF Transcript_15995/g.24209 Transcript_15995/m.24209 type:complete len:153 (+) Transcript_15995:118-576(+)
MPQGGSSALDLARGKGHMDIASALEEASRSHSDPSNLKLQKWLKALRAEEYASGFIKAGFDYDFIAENGLGEEDLDCVGVPRARLGVRKKLLKLYRIKEIAEKSDKNGSGSSRAASSASSEEGSGEESSSGSERSSRSSSSEEDGGSDDASS